jgi:hypothetical protein
MQAVYPTQQAVYPTQLQGNAPSMMAPVSNPATNPYTASPGAVLPLVNPVQGHVVPAQGSGALGGPTVVSPPQQHLPQQPVLHNGPVIPQQQHLHHPSAVYPQGVVVVPQGGAVPVLQGMAVQQLPR